LLMGKLAFKACRASVLKLQAYQSFSAKLPASTHDLK